ncbi:hypothetical protein H8356DRAFT_1676041 [Neocallimastix lanati (nom. inval.)]|jgi:hypothetical protein|nr:hypothetical protein H8356DRAFT_1676041 [Neocallimastix sp. JGI-2020a]
MMSVARKNVESLTTTNNTLLDSNSATMATKDQKEDPFSYRTTTIQEVSDIKKTEGEKDNKDTDNDDNKPSSTYRKRSRATPEQLAILEATFEKNTSPNSKLREALAEKVNMSERSIQIWFQNRRAKVKNTQKRNQQAAFQDQLFKSQFLYQYPGAMYAGYPPYGQPMYQPGMPKVMNRSKSIDATNMYGQSLNTVPEGAIVNPALGRLGFTQGGIPLSMGTEYGARSGLAAQNLSMVKPELSANYLVPSPEKNFYNFTNNALVIGTWRRIAVANDPDSLRCSFSIVEKQIRWLIKEQNIRFKVEFPFSTIGQILLEPIPGNVSAGKLSFTLIKVPKFWMETNGPTNPTWNLSGDFTENQQASQVFRHILEGDYSHLKNEVDTIVRSSPDLRQLCRIVPQGTPADLLYQSHFQRRQSCPAGLLLNSNNQYITSNRRLSIPTSSNLVALPQNVVVPLIQQPLLENSPQVIQTASVGVTAATGTATAIPKTATIGNGFVAPQTLTQAVNPAAAATATATATVANPDTTVQLQNAAALNIQKPLTAATALSPDQSANVTIASQTLPIGATKVSPVVPLSTIPENVIQPTVAAATATASNNNIINPLTLSGVTASATSNPTDLLNSAQTITKSGSFLMDNLNIMNGAQLTSQSNEALKFLTSTEGSENTLVDNTISTIGNNISLQSQETFDLGIDDNQFIMNFSDLSKNYM